VLQDPNDEPASELLKRIAAEKARLVKAGKFREPSNRIERNDLPFVPAPHWVWARLIDIARPSYGFAFPSGQFSSSKRGMPLIRIRDISSTDTEAYFDGDYDPAYLVTAGDYLVGMDGDFNLRRDRIVAKVDELMALCDRLEAARAEREVTCDRLAAATLSRLNSPDPETFSDDVGFALDAIPALTARPDQIKHLRQTILNLAMSGKLVPQDPNDEPASELLAKKRKLPSEYQRRRKILKDASVEAPAALFPELPSSWAYVDIQRLYDLNIVIDYADGNHGSLYPRSSEFGDSGVTFVSAKDLVDGKVNWESCSKLNQGWANQLTKGWSQCGDVLLTHNATVGRVARVKEKIDPFLLGTSVTFYRLNPEALSPDFFFYSLQSPLWQGQLEAIMTQTTRNQVSIQKQAFFRIALPPLSEQPRIVAKLDKLLGLCDRLEASLTTGDDTRRRLLDALLAEALMAVEDNANMSDERALADDAA
jgi:type I restriction enzyme, S subunit